MVATTAKVVETDIAEDAAYVDAEIVEAEAPVFEKELEPIEAEPVNSADFIRQWMHNTQK